MEAIGFVEIARVMLLALRLMKLFSYYHCILRRLYCVHLLYFLKICFYICMYIYVYVYTHVRTRVHGAETVLHDCLYKASILYSYRYSIRRVPWFEENFRDSTARALCVLYFLYCSAIVTLYILYSYVFVIISPRSTSLVSVLTRCILLGSSSSGLRRTLEYSAYSAHPLHRSMSIRTFCVTVTVSAIVSPRVNTSLSSFR